MNTSTNSVTTATRREHAVAMPAPSPLREEIGDALERLSRLLVQRVPDPLETRTSGMRDDDAARLQAVVRFLGQVMSEWHYVETQAQAEHAAGFGSTVEVEDVELGTHETYTLMTGAMLDFEAGQVSLASPIGHALLGSAPGMIVTVDTPQRRRRLRVLRLRTLREYVQHVRGA